jgi:hypothetical protein
MTFTQKEGYRYLFLMCLVLIGPGLTGGILMAQDRNIETLNVRRTRLQWPISMIKFKNPPGSTFGETYTEHDPHALPGAATDQRIVMPYRDVDGVAHRLVISNPADLMHATVELDPED